MRHIILILFLLPFTLRSQSLEDGKRAADNEKYSEAKSIFLTLLAKNPSNAELYYALGRVYCTLEQNDSARLLFYKGISVNDRVASNYIAIGKMQLDDKKTNEAKTNFDNALAISAKDSKTYMLIAEAHSTTSGQKDLNQAITLFNKAIELDKKNSRAHLLLGDAYLQQADGAGKAVSAYESAVELNPSLAEGFMKIGKIYTAAKNYEEALKAFQQGVTADPLYAPCYREFAELHFMAKHYNKACETFSKYLSLSDSNVSNMTRYAYFLFFNKDYTATIDMTNRVLQMDSSNAILKRLIAYSYFEQGKFNEGLSFIEKFFGEIDIKKIIASDYEYYGKLLAKKGNSDSLAIINLNKAISLDTTKTDLYGDIAQIYYQKKNYTDAARHYEMKLEKGKPNSLDYFLLGKAYYYANGYAKADSAFTKVTELSPKSHIGYMWRGRSNSNMDSTVAKESAKPFYEKTAELAAADSLKYKKDLLEALQFLGIYALQKDDNEKTKMYFLRVLAMDPENKDAQKVIAELKKQKK